MQETPAKFLLLEYVIAELHTSIKYFLSFLSPLSRKKKNRHVSSAS